jgi:hypothetical protein
VYDFGLGRRVVAQTLDELVPDLLHREPPVTAPDEFVGFLVDPELAAVGGVDQEIPALLAHLLTMNAHFGPQVRMLPRDAIPQRAEKRLRHRATLRATRA